MSRRVVITGMGTVNCLSQTVKGYWEGLLAGRSGIGPIGLFDTTAFKVHFGGEVRDFHPETILDTRAAKRMDRFSQFSMLAGIAAVRESGLDFSREAPYRCGSIIGPGIGGFGEFAEQHGRLLKGGPGKISPFLIPKLMANAAPANIAIHYGLAGPNTAVTTACASAANAITDAFHTMQRGEADIMITGGTEAALTGMGLGGFISAQALSKRNDDPQGASRPFDKERNGFVLSEGAGLVVLEELEHARKRGAIIHAELLGCGSTCDAHNITAPHPEGSGAARAMRLALEHARVKPEDVQYVNAHGTSTELGDEAETRAIKLVFGGHAGRLAISSTKSMIGHLLGASGGVELIATVMSIKHSVVHPTINYHTPDPACDLDYVPNTAREMRVRYALSNSFGFGGHNCSLLVGAYN